MLDIETFICMLFVTSCFWNLVLRIYVSCIMLEIDSFIWYGVCNILLLVVVVLLLLLLMLLFLFWLLL